MAGSLGAYFQDVAHERFTIPPRVQCSFVAVVYPGANDEEMGWTEAAVSLYRHVLPSITHRYKQNSPE